MKILAVLFKTLGDVCMGTTVVHALKQKYPDSKIDFVTMPQNKHILEGNPDINEIITLDNYYDANMLAIDGGYDEIYRLNMAEAMDSVWHHLPDQKDQHLVEWYAKRADIEKLDDKNIYIYLNEEDIESVDDYWEDLDPEQKYIAVHTTSGAHPGQAPVVSKDWPNFDALVSMIESQGYKVIQIGAFSDRKIKSDSVIDFTGKFTFKQTAEVLKRCKAFVGVDSGPAYLAGWAGIPCVLVMGSTQNIGEGKGPNVGPRNDNVHYINAPKPNNPNCSPVPCYINCQVPEKQAQGGCIFDIKSQEVASKLFEVIDATKV